MFDLALATVRNPKLRSLSLSLTVAELGLRDGNSNTGSKILKATVSG